MGPGLEATDTPIMKEWDKFTERVYYLFRRLSISYFTFRALIAISMWTLTRKVVTGSSP
jgi:hypothetical protein